MCGFKKENKMQKTGDKMLGSKFFPLWIALGSYALSNMLAVLCYGFMKNNIILAICFIISSVILWVVGTISILTFICTMNNYFDIKIKELSSGK